MAAAEFRAKLIEAVEIAPEVRHFVFEAQGLERFAYAAGQFVMLYKDLEGKLAKRAYSIASAPDGKRFELCLNKVREGLVSPFLFELRPGDEVEWKGPYGAFRWREPPGDALLAATGTGIAPLRAMLWERVPRDSAHRFTLLFGVRHEDGILYRDEFEEMAARYPNFTFLPTLSRPGAGWKGLRGRVQEHLADAACGRTDLDVYICGLREMVRSVRDMLALMGFDSRRVIFERYD